ncbi:hypothetical protein Cgig2_029236 [Carnegiea gigantea]|uniref:Uncharacterized protein n=1 Tax=Carnegiea gigantea TaxID=171969 RepID=A0A9Q1GVV5_9CARY|nr:hypothetical protein Cgig2_029236 [Carnegiea gigantea]
MAYQLLCNYAEHVQRWGWICNIFCQDSGSFNKDLNRLNGQPMHLSLLAVCKELELMVIATFSLNWMAFVQVPCILSVDFSDADLLEFLEQILGLQKHFQPIFPLLFDFYSEVCSWKADTVPLVNLEALHKNITQIGSWCEGSKNLLHGVCRKEINLERAKRRLDVATSRDAAYLHGLFALLLLHVL